MLPPLRVGVIGLGSIGRRHVGNLLALGCEVWGADSSRSACWDAIVAYPSLRAFSSHHAFLEIDAYVIATPYTSHLELVEYCAWIQKPFFVEKPVGSLEQLPRWRELAAMELPVNQVGYMLRFHPVVAEMTQRVPHPSSGGFHVECDMSTWPGTAYGPALLEMSHEIDLALHYGAPPIATAVDIDGPWTMFNLGHFGIRMNSTSSRYKRAWVVAGHGTGYMWHFDSPAELGDEMYRAEMAHFLDCVRTQRPTSVPLADGVPVLEVVSQVEALCASSR